MKQEKDSNERNDRRETNIPVEFRSGREKVSALIKNISGGGMCIETTTPLPANSKSFFRLNLKDSSMQYHVEGEVIWSNLGRRNKRRISSKKPGRMGVRFLTSRFFTEEVLQGMLSNCS